MKKYHVSVFTANLLAIVLAMLFVKGYKTSEIPITNVFLIMIVILAIFMLLIIFILKPQGRIKSIFPKNNLLMLNVGISLAFGLVFLKQTGLMGFMFVMVFSFLLFEIEHIIYEGIGR